MTDDDPRFRPGWTTEPAAEAIWRPLVDPEHPCNQPGEDGTLLQEAPNCIVPYYWSKMPPAQLAALLDLAPWECPLRPNGQPAFGWFLGPLAESFPDVTFHGYIHTRVAQMRVEGFQLFAPADRVLELMTWLKGQKIPASRLHVTEWRKEGDLMPVRPDDWGLERRDDGTWDFWWWWD
jgi:hypothetical protein